MSEHHSFHCDYQEIIKYENKIMQLLNHNVHRYKYTGEPGKEYEVIQSIFREINHTTQLSNKHIRWYAVIINLRMSFQNRQRAANSGDGFLDSSLLESTAGVVLLDPAGANDSQYISLPSYINLLDLYVNEIARLGMLVCTKEKINPGYLEYKLERIDSFLAELLEAKKAQKQEETREEVFVLTIGNATDNVIKLEKFLLNTKKSIKTINTRLYGNLINRRIQGIDKKRLAGYHNMDDFWNGFIP